MEAILPMLFRTHCQNYSETLDSWVEFSCLSAARAEKKFLKRGEVGAEGFW
jgi:hypothetical protein